MQQFLKILWLSLFASMTSCISLVPRIGLTYLLFAQNLPAQTISAQISSAQIVSGNIIPIQGLPKFPPEQDPESPILEQQDLIPEKPLPDEALPDFGQNKNASERKEAELVNLFTSLKTTANVEEAAKISRQIQGLWAQSGSSTVDLLMQWAEDGIVKENYAMALDYIDNIIALKPDYAEGWMRRAAIHVQLNDLKMAMFDLEKSLQYEPRNYNAIALLGTLMEMTGREELAIKAYQQALIYYPQNRRVQTRIGELLEKRTDRAI